MSMLGLAFSTVCTADVKGAEIHGTVNVPGAVHTPPPRYLGGGTSGVKGNPQTELIAVAVEWLDSAMAPAVTDTALVMAQENTWFVPNLLVVPVGGQVTFPNHDAIFHNVFSYSPPHSFDLGRYPKGQTRTVRFEEHGIVRIFCEIHASMYGTILVVNSNWYRVINAGIPFDFGGLPSGNFRVIAVDAAGRRSMQDVHVDASESKSVSLTLK
ncbi:MAG: hypothetical protein HZB43_00910 [candidate division Zixibacteria bacterium]|nr:hypothetical protein [candidate division Zixibacteria bacterium]